MTRRLKGLALLVGLTLLAAGCAAGKAYRQGDAATRAGNLDEAVAAYRRAVQAAPNNTQFRIALERTMLAASRSHLEKARDFEQKDQLDAAISEYRLAAEYDPSNRLASAKVAALDRMIRDRIESSRPAPAIQALRERARATSPEPILNPASREPLVVRFNNASLKDVLSAVSGLTGINITYDRDVQDRAITVQLDGVTLEQALNQIMTMNQMSYKVVSDRSIFVFQDNAQKHAQYDEQVVRTFYISHADPTEMSQLLSTIIRLPGIAVQPAIAVNRTTNTVTVRGTSSVVQILERIIAQNDKPRAEVVIDVEILEVDRSRAKTYGLNLSEYAVGGIFSPETSPTATTAQTPGATTGTPTGVTPTTPAATTGGTTTTTTTGGSTAPSGVRSPAPFNLNTISRGINTADFYLAVPTAIVRFLESDSRTRVVAKPQLRGAEGTKISLNLGSEIPVVSTSYTPIATGGAGVNPLSSYQYRPVGVNIDMTPRVSLEGDVILDLTLDDSALGGDVAVAGVTVPSFVSRKVTTRLRLRDGESNLLAGLIQEREANTVRGFPGAIHLPLFRQLLSDNVRQNDQIEIVMLLTPHIVRTQELTETDLQPIYIGSQQNLGVGGPPPLIAPPPAAEAAAAPPAGTPAQPYLTTPGGQPLRGPGGTTLAPPPGTTPIPGTVAVPPAATPTPTPALPPPVTEPPATPTPALPAPATPPATPPAPTPPEPQIPAAQPATEPPITSPGVGSARVVMSPSGTTFRVGGGPYIIPISISDAARISTMTLTLTFDATKLRVRNVQEGSFMRAGGANVTFNQQAGTNRIDITLSRGADATGASGTGLLAAVLFDAIAPGTVTLTLNGAATGPGGTAMGLQFRPVTITVQ
jgi:general secretion pathway protein D